MNKNVLYFVATLLAIVIVMLVSNRGGETPQDAEPSGSALPTNGLVGATTGQAAHETSQPATPSDTPVPSSEGR